MTSESGLLAATSSCGPDRRAGRRRL